MLRMPHERIMNDLPRIGQFAKLLQFTNRSSIDSILGGSRRAGRPKSNFYFGDAVMGKRWIVMLLAMVAAGCTNNATQRAGDEED